MNKKYTIYDGENGYNLIENATASEAGWAWATYDNDQYRFEKNDEGYFEVFCRRNGTSKFENIWFGLIAKTEDEARIEAGEEFFNRLKNNQGRFSVIEA